MSRLAITDTLESPVESMAKSILGTTSSSSVWQNLGTWNILRILDSLKVFAPPNAVDPANNPSSILSGTWDILRVIDSLNIFGPVNNFRYFPCLPPEIRSLIWKWALIEEVSQRLVPLDKASRRILRPDHLVSPLLSTNGESRWEAMGFYEIRVEVHMLPAMVANTSYRPGRHLVGRSALHAEAERAREGDSNKTGGEVVGVCYISAIRDTFALITAKYDNEPIAWKLERPERLSSEPLPLHACGRVRRLAYYCKPPSASNRPRRQVIPTFDLIEMVRCLLADAQSHWAGTTFPALRHHGAYYVDRLAPADGMARKFLGHLERNGHRGSYVFRRFIRKVERSGVRVWEPEIDESLLGLIPHPEQTFALTMEDLEDLVGAI
ncbi:hypothetical protein SLS62_000140 [Diatrype stigma]|uniref:2EXR domain-containing protein n=1 Tax=Diatrype stigma TaxID=117547 RepID=A0AAN9V3J4_9PEZI